MENTAFKVDLKIAMEILNGLCNDDCTCVLRAALVIRDLIKGTVDIECEEAMKHSFKVMLYESFMRSYTRIIKDEKKSKELMTECHSSIAYNGKFMGMEKII